MGFHLIFIVFVLFIKKLQHIMFLPWVAGWWKSKQFATHVLMIDIIFWVPWSLSQSTCLNCYPPMELIWLVLEGYRFLPSFVVFYFIPRPSLRDYEVCIMIEEGVIWKKYTEIPSTCGWVLLDDEGKILLRIVGKIIMSRNIKRFL